MSHGINRTEKQIFSPNVCQSASNFNWFFSRNQLNNHKDIFFSLKLHSICRCCSKWQKTAWKVLLISICARLLLRSAHQTGDHFDSWTCVDPSVVKPTLFGGRFFQHVLFFCWFSGK